MQNAGGQDGDSGSVGKRRRGRGRSVKYSRVMVTMNQALLEMVDKAAEEDFTTRSDLIRQALLWFLRPQGRDLRMVDPATIVKAIKRREDLAWSKKFMRDYGKDLDVYDS